VKTVTASAGLPGSIQARNLYNLRAAWAPFALDGAAVRATIGEELLARRVGRSTFVCRQDLTCYILTTCPSVGPGGQQFEPDNLLDGHSPSDGASLPRMNSRAVQLSSSCFVNVDEAFHSGLTTSAAHVLTPGALAMSTPTTFPQPAPDTESGVKTGNNQATVPTTSSYDAHLFVAKHLFVRELLGEGFVSSDDLIGNIPLPSGVSPSVYDEVPEHFVASGICEAGEIQSDISPFTAQPTTCWFLDDYVGLWDWLVEHPLTKDEMHQAGVPHLWYLAEVMTQETRDRLVAAPCDEQLSLSRSHLNLAQQVFLWELLETGYATSDSMVASVDLPPSVNIGVLEPIPQQFADLGFCERDEALSPTWSRFAEYPITGWVLNEDMEEEANRWLDENEIEEAGMFLRSFQPDFIENPLPEEARFGGAEAPPEPAIAIPGAKQAAAV
jgi:hypothetical protein